MLKMNATGQLGWIDSPSKLDEVVERVKEVKAHGMDVGLDFHGRLHKGMAKQLAKKLEAVEPYFIEEPLLPYQEEELRVLYQMTSIPIATGERLTCRQECRPYFEKASAVRRSLRNDGNGAGLHGHLSVGCISRWRHLGTASNHGIRRDVRYRLRTSLSQWPDQLRRVTAAWICCAELCHLRNVMASELA